MRLSLNRSQLPAGLQNHGLLGRPALRALSLYRGDGVDAAGDLAVGKIAADTDRESNPWVGCRLLGDYRVAMTPASANRTDRETGEVVYMSDSLAWAETKRRLYPDCLQGLRETTDARAV